MHDFSARILLLVLVLSAAGCLCGCTGPDALPAWMMGGSKSDSVAGMPSPPEQMELLEKLADKAARATPEEKQRISSELAAAYREEEDPLLRREIVRTIRHYDTPEAASVLGMALNDSAAEVRVAACKAWGEVGGPDAVARLGVIVSSDVDADVRLAAVKALGRTNEPGAIGPLGQALADSDPSMQYLAMESLGEVSGQDFGGDVERWQQYVQNGPPPRREGPSLAERLPWPFRR